MDEKGKPYKTAGKKDYVSGWYFKAYKNVFIECKNLYGNIEVDSQGNFTRTVSYGKYYKKEGIYSPIT